MIFFKGFLKCHKFLTIICCTWYPSYLYLKPIILTTCTTYVSKTYLDSSVHYNDPILNLPGYKLVRAGNLSNNKKGGAGIYFKKTLAVQPVPINCLNKCFLLEVFIENKKGFVLSPHKSPCQSQEEFYDFLFSLDQLLSNMISQNLIFLSTTGDFNVRNSSWWKNDCVTRDGTKTESVTCCYRLCQLTSDPTHILWNSSSCIDLGFMNQPNFVIDSSMHPSLHPNCHNLIVFWILNLKVKYLPLYERFMWDYENTDSQSIIKAIEIFNWEKLFQNKTILDQLKLFNEAIASIVHN